jgi:hypothetical protein
MKRQNEILRGSSGGALFHLSLFFLFTFTETHIHRGSLLFLLLLLFTNQILLMMLLEQSYTSWCFYLSLCTNLFNHHLLDLILHSLWFPIENINFFFHFRNLMKNFYVKQQNSEIFILILHQHQLLEHWIKYKIKRKYFFSLFMKFF